MSRLLGVASLLLLGCSAGAPAAVVRPQRQTFGDAAGIKACTTPPSLARPLAVDWRPEDRGDLEVVMKQAIAVVAYDCQSVRVLPDCRVEGTYGYIGIAKKEQLLRLEGADELAANLPFSGGHVAASMNRDSTLDVALALVGQRVASRPQLGRAELHGDCGSATHFVRSASVGAFVLKTGTAAKVEAAADVFAFASSGKSSSNEAIVNRDGDLAACNATTADDAKASPACSSLVRLELKALQDGDSSAPPDPFLEQVTTNACPAGLSEQAGKCGRPAAGKPHLCEYGNPQDCRTQCGAGDGASCTRLGLMHERGEGVSASPSAAIASYQKACEPPQGQTSGYAPPAVASGYCCWSNPTHPSHPPLRSITSAALAMPAGCKAAKPASNTSALTPTK